MWWKVLGQPFAVSFLLSSSNIISRTSTETEQQKILAGNNAIHKKQQLKKLNYAPTSLKEITNDMNNIYQDLVDNPMGPVKQITPTIKFSFVSPPVNGISTWRRSANNNENITTFVEEETTSAFEANTSAAVVPDSRAKPIAIYLPGLDGTGISAFNFQFDDLAENFELWRLIIPINDRSSFSQVIQAVVKFIDEISSNDNRDIIIIGESFGGVLGAAVASKLQNRDTRKPVRVGTAAKTKKITSSIKDNKKNPLKGLVLVNPATAFHETNWDTVVPLLASLQYLSSDEGGKVLNSTAALMPKPNLGQPPTPYSLVGGLALSYLMPDPDQFQNIVTTLFNAVVNNGNNVLDDDIIEDMYDMLAIIEERLPADVLQHRVNRWLMEGTPVVNERLHLLKDLPVLIVAGTEDKVMPSDKEVNRLMKVLPHSEKLVVRGSGHFVLDDKVNLTEAILYSEIDPLNWKNEKKKRYDPITDWKLPPKDEVEATLNGAVKPLRDVFSPIFFSTDEKGKRWMGLSKVQRTDNNPILFVANHQFAGLDLSLIISELLEERGIMSRGLGHPFIFNNTKYFELLGRTPGLRSKKDNTNNAAVNFQNMQKFGAVPVSPKNYFRLLQTKQDVLLFPGGVKDVFDTRKTYPLNWPSDEKPDFIRTAARFNATIIPISAIGMVDSIRVLVEFEDVENIPFIGKQLKSFGSSMPAARFDAKEGETEPGVPLIAPSMPARNYFLFGKPISTVTVDPKDKQACTDLYKEIVKETRNGLDDLLRARERDPFKDTPSRIAFERVTGKTAPTFSVDELNR